MLLYPKDLTPASLAAIVEGVPVEATPPRMVYKGGVFPSWFDQFSERESAQIATDVAALAWIGSMTFALCQKRRPLICSHPSVVAIYFCGPLRQAIGEAVAASPTLLQSLALACREVSK